MIFDHDPGSGGHDSDDFAEFHDLLFGSVPGPTDEESDAMFDETLNFEGPDHPELADVDNLLHSTGDYLTIDPQNALEGHGLEGSGVDHFAAEGLEDPAAHWEGADGIDDHSGSIHGHLGYGEPAFEDHGFEPGDFRDGDLGGDYFGGAG